VHPTAARWARRRTLSDSSADTHTAGTTDGDPPFGCPAPFEELAPGYCFERYDIALPGPLVMERAVGADIDGDGADALALELDLDGVQTLTLWDFDDDAGAALSQEIEVDDNDFEHTKLLRSDRLLMDDLRTLTGRESVLSHAPWMLELCDPAPEGSVLSCTRAEPCVRLSPPRLAARCRQQSESRVHHCGVGPLGPTWFRLHCCLIEPRLESTMLGRRSPTSCGLHLATMYLRWLAGTSTATSDPTSCFAQGSTAQTPAAARVVP
jgi:hypothetical protein